MSPLSGSRAVLYIRVSTMKQVERGHSLDAQREALEAYARSHSLEVVEVIVDRGESAGTLDRPGLRRALALIDAGEVDLVVATKGDRISRNLRDLLNLAARLAESGSSIATVDGTFDTTTPVGKAMTQMQGVFAELERDMAGQRTREGMAAAKAKGVRLGRPPVGYTSERGTLVPIEGDPRLELARRAWGMVQAGQSLAQVAAALQAESAPTPTGKGVWYPATVSRLIRGPRAEAAFST